MGRPPALKAERLEWPKRCQFLNQCRRRHAQQHAEAVNGLPGRCLQQGDLRRCGRHLSLGVGHIQAACESAFETLAGQPGAVFLGLEVLPGNRRFVAETREGQCNSAPPPP